jgi:hypothetical protein
VLTLTVTNPGIAGTVTVGTSSNNSAYTVLTTAQNTCTAGIAAGQSCVLPVQFTPASAGAINGVLTVTANGVAPITVTLQGSGDTLNAGSSTMQFGSVAFGSSAVMQLTVTNPDISGTVAVGTSTTGSSFTVLAAQNTCLSGIAPGQSCVLPVQFTPAAIGAATGTLTVTANGVAPINVGLQGTGSDLTAGASSLQFGTIASGATSVLTLTVTNSGIAGTVIPGTAISNSSFTVLTTSQNTCQAGITAGQSCVLPVQFSPTSVSSYSGTLTLSATGQTPVTVQLAGAATGLTVSSTTLAFGSVQEGANSTLQLTITNPGISGTVRVGTSLTGTDYTVLTNSQNTCAAGITSGQSCVLPVQFAPSVVGADNASLTVTANGGSPVSVQLTGTGGALVVSPATLQFGTIVYGGSEVLPLTVTNSGIPGTVVPGATTSGPSYAILTTSQNTCQAGIAAGQSCVLPVQFSPTSAAVHNGTITITAGSEAPIVVQALGSGASLTTNTATLQFGTIEYGATSVLLLTVTNPGIPGTVTIGTSINGPSYTILTTAQNTCQAGIASGQSCVLPVQFTPSSTGTHNDVLSLTASGGGSPITVQLNGTAVTLTTSSTSLQFGTITNGTTEVINLTVTNPGIPGTVTVGTTFNGPYWSVLTTAQNTCQAGIATGQSCVLPIQFAPTSSGSHNHTVVVTGNGVGPVSVQLVGSSSN